MASTLTKLLIHVTFSTKHRAATIPQALEPNLYAYIGGICRRMESPLLAMGGVADHVHLLVSLSKTVTLSELMLNIKRDSSKWIKDQDPTLSGFAWQDGYFAFSLGESGAAALKTYIAHQKEHHKTVSFKDEVLLLLAKYRIEYNERYIWE
jgi:putative transposase